MPTIETIEVPTYEPEGPFGAKEAAEGTVAPCPPAIANAALKMFGVEFNSNVFTPEKVLKAIKEKEAKGK